MAEKDLKELKELKDLQNLFEGVQIPKESTNVLKKTVKKVYVKPVCSDEELEKKEAEKNTVSFHIKGHKIPFILHFSILLE